MDFKGAYSFLYDSLLQNVDIREQESSSSSSSHSSSFLEVTSNLQNSSSKDAFASEDSKSSVARESSDSDNDSAYKKVLEHSKNQCSSSRNGKATSGQDDEYVDEEGEEEEEEIEELGDEEEVGEPLLKRRKNETKAKKNWPTPPSRGDIHVVVHPHALADKNSSSLKIASGKRVSFALKNCSPFVIHDRKENLSRLPLDDLMRGEYITNLVVINKLKKMYIK